MLLALIPGRHEIYNLADNEDVKATRHCLSQLGVVFSQHQSQLTLTAPPRLQAPSEPLDCKNSGTTMRLLAGILAAQPFESTLTGDHSLLKRPMQRVTEPLGQMGAIISTRGPNGTGPIHISPSLQGLSGIHYKLPHASAQVKSALLLAGLFAKGETHLEEPTPSRDHTERMLRHLGVELHHTGQTLIFPGQQRAHLKATSTLHIPGDFSSAAYWLVQALFTPNTILTLNEIGLNPGRTGLMGILQQAGATIKITETHLRQGEPVGTLVVKTSRLTGNISLEAHHVPALIDEIPILAVAGIFLEGTLTVSGAKELRVKESDRIQTLVAAFQALGIDIRETADGFVIHGNPQWQLPEPQATPIVLACAGDHRIAMSLLILKALAKIPDTRVDIDGRAHIAVSYPGFEAQLNAKDPIFS